MNIKMIFGLIIIFSSIALPEKAQAYDMFCSRNGSVGFDTLTCRFTWTFGESLIAERRRQSTAVETSSGPLIPLHNTGPVAPLENTHFVLNPSGLMLIGSEGWLEYLVGDESGCCWYTALYWQPAADEDSSVFPLHI